MGWLVARVVVSGAPQAHRRGLALLLKEGQGLLLGPRQRVLLVNELDGVVEAAEELELGPLLERAVDLGVARWCFDR